MSEEQKIIIINKDQYLLVIAGAGCGKTTTIIEKVKYLLNNGYTSEDILIISFTNATVNDIKRRLPNNITVKTFHKLALEILENNVHEISGECFFDFTIQEYFKYLVDKKMMIKYLGIRHYEKSNAYKEFISLMKRFFNLYKANNGDYHLLAEIYLKNILSRKRKQFLKLFNSFYLYYQNELKSKGSYDFNDLIIEASKSNNKLKYKYIIVDEFQDTSLIRLNLIKKIVNDNNACLCCVGDDYQSIYQFSGSNIFIFINFKKYFPEAKVMYLTHTYRNSMELVNVASHFIMKNDLQIKKVISSDKHLDKPIKIIYYNDELKAINYCLTKDKEMMFLGRHLKNNRGLTNFYTVHTSKGLESNNVAILCVNDDTLGFPNKIVDHKLIEELINNQDKYLYAEERRLFYVALTRTKNYVYLLVPSNNASLFVKELEKDYNDAIEIIKL